MKIIDYIKENPKLSEMFTSDALVLFFLICGGILANFGEALPAGISAVLGAIVKIYNILVTSGILNKREEIIVEATGQSVNENLKNGVPHYEENPEEIYSAETGSIPLSPNYDIDVSDLEENDFDLAEDTSSSDKGGA